MSREGRGRVRRGGKTSEEGWNLDDGDSYLSRLSATGARVWGSSHWVEVWVWDIRDAKALRERGQGDRCVALGRRYWLELRIGTQISFEGADWASVVGCLGVKILECNKVSLVKNYQGLIVLNRRKS